MKTRVHRVTIPFRLNPNGELFLVACTSLRPPRKVESKVAPGFTTAWVAARSVEGFLLLEVPGKYRSSHSSRRKLFNSRLVLARAPLGNIYVAFGNARVGAPARVTTRFLLIPSDVDAWPTSPCACFILVRRPFPGYFYYVPSYYRCTLFWTTRVILFSWYTTELQHCTRRRAFDFQNALYIGERLVERSLANVRMKNLACQWSSSRLLRGWKSEQGFGERCKVRTYILYSIIVVTARLNVRISLLYIVTNLNRIPLSKFIND